MSQRNDMDEITSVPINTCLVWILNVIRGDEVQWRGYSETRHLGFFHTLKFHILCRYTLVLDEVRVLLIAHFFSLVCSEKLSCFEEECTK